MIVDPSSLVTAHVAARIRDRLGWEVAVADEPAAAPAHPVDVLVTELTFPGEGTGLDVLEAAHRGDRGTQLVVYTHGDPRSTDLLAIAWHAFPLAAAFTKAQTLEGVLTALRAVERREAPWIGAELRHHLPPERSPWRTSDGYGRLVAHAGHAKLWRALIELPVEPSYEQIAAHADVDPKTIRNYRQDLLDELELHGLHRPSMRRLQTFAKDCRPLLARHVSRRLARTFARR
jgi:DNA-binding NarL/FixJ family response regulator